MRRDGRGRRAAELFLKAEAEGTPLEVRDVAARFGMTPASVSTQIRKMRLERKQAA